MKPRHLANLVRLLRSNGRAPRALNIGEARTRCEYWQQVLGIADWIIDVQIVRGYQIGDKAGRCVINSHDRIARISLCDKIDIVENSNCTDMEMTLVHELLHVVLHDATGDIAEGSAKSVGEERAINSLAAALVALSRAAEAAR